MPRHRNFKCFIVDLVLFVTAFALLGHLTLHFWERFVIQKELSQMRSSLHSLKKTINRIGCAYDNLHSERLELTETTENNYPCVTANDDYRKRPYKKKQTFQDQETFPKQEINVTTTNEDTAQTSCQTVDETNGNNTNATTLTKYPLKSLGVGLSNAKCAKEMCDIVCCNDNCKYRKDKCKPSDRINAYFWKF